MKRNRILNAVFSLAFTAAAVFTPAFAQPGEHMDMGRHGMMMGKMAKELNLTDDQKAKMKEIFSSLRESTKGTREEIRKNREAIHQMMKDGSYTEGKANEILTRNAELQRQMQLAALNKMNEAKKLLTAEQQQKLEKIMSERKEKMKDRINDRREKMKEKKSERRERNK